MGIDTTLKGSNYVAISYDSYFHVIFTLNI